MLPVAPITATSARNRFPQLWDTPQSASSVRSGFFNFSPLSVADLRSPVSAQLKAPVPTPRTLQLMKDPVLSRNTMDPQGNISPSLLWSKLTGQEFQLKVIPDRHYSIGSQYSKPRGFQSISRAPQNSPHSFALPKAAGPGQGWFRHSDVQRKLEAITPPLSARTDASVERVFPEAPLCEFLCTDTIVLESKNVQESNPQMDAATERLVLAVNYIRELYAHAARATLPKDRGVWADRFDEFLQADSDNEYEEAVVTQLVRIRDQLEGKRGCSSSTILENGWSPASAGTGSASFSEAWFDHVRKLRAPGPLKFAGEGDLKEILTGSCEAKVVRERSGLVIEDAQGGRTKVESNNEKVMVQNCFSAHIEIEGVCKTLRIVGCDNCCITMGHVSSSVRMENSQKVQLIFKGAVSSVIYE
eukprot:GEMP01002932.1.p1 GENE.GEMP01002932.1~~GEMP01002932.1.p1  ORF type:complete len:416 (+),score=62.80 GEMP01002932.1:355-1602(+)